MECRVFDNSNKPYLSYTIIVESSRIGSYKLPKNTLSLYQKICELRFDENLTWNQCAERLNKEGWKGTYGKTLSGGSCSSVYQKCRKHFERKHKYLPPDLDDVKLILE